MRIRGGNASTYNSNASGVSDASLFLRDVSILPFHDPVINGSPVAPIFFPMDGTDFHFREYLNSKRIIRKENLPPGSFEMKISCTKGKIKCVLKVENQHQKSLLREERTLKSFDLSSINFSSLSSSSMTPSLSFEEVFHFDIEENDSPCVVEIFVEERGLKELSLFEVSFQCIKIFDHFVQPNCWKIGQTDEGEDFIIGMGATATVYLGLNTKNGRMIAIKQFSLDEELLEHQKQEKLKHLENDLKLMKTLNHPNIVRYLGMERQKENIYIFMDLIMGGNLIEMFEKFPFSEDLLRIVSKQILSGLSYLHTKGIIHRDIKLENVLYDKNGQVFITDFGTGFLFNSDNNNNNETKSSSSSCEISGTIPFWAPEIFLRREYSFKSDVWAFGCCLFQLITQQRPWEDIMNLEHLQGNVFGFMNEMKRRFMKNEKQEEEEEEKVQICDLNELPISESLRDLLSKCFEKDPLKRPTVQQLLNHSFFKETSKKEEKEKQKQQNNSIDELFDVFEDLSSKTVVLAEEKESLKEIMKLEKKRRKEPHQIIKEFSLKGFSQRIQKWYKIKISQSKKKKGERNNE